MMAIILAGGKGARLKPFTMSIPKPLLPLGETPILEVVIQQLMANGIKKLVLSLGHMSYFFTSFVERWKKNGTQIQCQYEDEPLGTAGAIAMASDLEENFLILNGDILTTLDYSSLIAKHLETDAWGTIGISRRELKVDYGVIEMKNGDELDNYQEKPILNYNVSMGINVLSRRCLQFITAGQKLDIPELMMRMKNADKPVMCFPTSCYWQDIGRFEDYQIASKDYLENPKRFLERPSSKK